MDPIDPPWALGLLGGAISAVTLSVRQILRARAAVAAERERQATIRHIVGEAARCAPAGGLLVVYSAPLSGGGSQEAGSGELETSR
ncbi:hypothetical protein AB0K60_13585 [Thermopolyspora sp. NPDC052614]|uniref:hypothetical protein n=1 Tax=Thermopolyspora sp. NPDC052614 TaxID=3155682 RepID=UPI0034432348